MSERRDRWETVESGAATPEDAGAGPVLDAYFDGGEPDRMLQRAAPPLPFVGDVRAEALAAVVVALHPGGGGDPAWFERVRTRGWSATAATWDLPAAALAWWRSAAGWAARLAGTPPSLRSIVGLHLLPWHAPRFGRLLLHDRRVGPEAIRWFDRKVFQPAAALASRSALARRADCPLRRPVVLCLSTPVRQALEHCGWKRLEHLDRTSGPLREPNWPLDDDGRPAGRTVSLLLQPQRPFAVAVAVGGDEEGGAPPGEAWDRVVARLLRAHACPCAAAHAVGRAG